MSKDKDKMQGVNAELDGIKTPRFKGFDNVKEILKSNLESKQFENIESKKLCIEAKYIASWHITSIRLHTYGEQAPQDKEQAQKSYKEICKHADKGIAVLEEIESWDYDMAMLYITLQGYKFIGARLHFLDTPKDLQDKYQQAFRELDSICNTAEDSKEYSENDKQNSNEDIEIVKGESKEDSENSNEDSTTAKEVSKEAKIAGKLKPHLTHPHFKAYLEYYRFLYVQRQMEQAAQDKKLQDFKQHLYEAQRLIEKLLIGNTHHIYLLTKLKKHRAHIMNLVWHIELKELGKQLEEPFNPELSDNTHNKSPYDILPESDKLCGLIEDI